MVRRTGCRRERSGETRTYQVFVQTKEPITHIRNTARSPEAVKATEVGEKLAT